MTASGRLRVKLAFYVGLFPTGADLLGLYLGAMATPLVWGAALALIAWLTTLVWP